MPNPDVVRTWASSAARLVTLNNGLQVVAAVLGLWGTHYINSADARGFLLWIGGNFTLIWLQMRMRLWVLAVVSGAYLYMSLQGFVAWQQKSPQSLPHWVPAEAVRLVSQLV